MPSSQINPVAIGEPAPHSALLRAGLLVLILLNIALCCVSLIKVAEYQSYMPYDRQHLAAAVAIVAAFSPVALLFVLGRFSFGYFTGFYLYTMVVGFLWLTRFTLHEYDTTLAVVSAGTSAILFLIPALLVNAPIRQVFVPSRQNFERLLAAIMALTVVTIAAGSMYNFKVVSLSHIYDIRAEISYPTIIRYLIGIVPSALLPFAFGSYLALRSYWKAAVALLLFPLFYPLTVSKLMFFAPFWILVLSIASRAIEARVLAILSLAVPMILGLTLISLVHHDEAYPLFNLINIRMIATPSSALDFYNDFFAHHPQTWFCQISLVKEFASCPYREPLAIVMQHEYQIGNLNASLFATEGVASVGLYLTPLAALTCGLIIAVGNRASSGLPDHFILISAALLPQIMLNVPLTVTMITHGGSLLFLLWYMTPRSIFEPDSA